MKKYIRYKIDKELEKKRNDADRSLFRAKCRFVKWDLCIRMGREPTKDEVLGVAMDNPLTILEVRECIRAYKRNRLARKRAEMNGDPLNNWENLRSPWQKQNTLTDADARLQLEFLKECELP